MNKRVSYSKIDVFWSCPYLYKLRYLDKLKAKPDERPDCALYEGTSIHEAIEKRDKTHGLNVYKSNYKEVNLAHDIEMYKLEKAMDMAISEVPHGEYEYKLMTDDFIGYIDMLVKVDEGVYDLYDFKFSNSDYKDSGQVHVYSYYYEKITGNKIRDIYYVMIPKCPDKYQEGCNIDELKEKIDKYYRTHTIRYDKVDFDRQKVNYFFARKALMEKEKAFDKRYSFKCGWCEFQRYCSTNGRDRSELIEETKEVDLWGKQE